ncbi:MAG: CoA-binding protein [Acidobacteria bacterium]|nr:MAG: CoA-binding protein [Acidobacteriota bacterium]
MEDRVLELLKRAKTIAVVGLSNDPGKPSNGVARYLQSKGYRVVPINPNLTEALGQKAYSSLSEAAKEEHIDIVDVFRRPDAVAAIVDEVLALGIPALWLQETVVDEEAAEKARQAGVFVVMDRCILKEHMRYRL